MKLLRRMAGTAVGVGVLAGLLLAAMQAVWVTPLIREAERYEAAARPTEETAAPAPGDAAPEPAPRRPQSPPPGAVLPWHPAPGLERNLYTLLADVLAGVGFALLVVAGLVLHGHPPTAARGLMWGAAGYAAFVLAPALGLPPEVPGTVVAPLAERQWWWVGTVAATAAALALVTFLPARVKVLGLPLLLLPHLLGAPEPPLPPAAGPPATLVGHFVAAALVTSAAFWAALGSGCGWLLARWR